MAEVLRWSQTVIDLADGDPAKGQLHSVLGRRWRARWRRAVRPDGPGRPGWRDDLDQAVAMARSADPLALAVVILQLRRAIPQWGAVGRRLRAARDRGGAADRRAIE